MDKLIITGSIVKRYQMEVEKQTGKKQARWNILPGDTVWTECEKVADLCQKHNWDTTIYVMSRFDGLGRWAVKKFKTQSLPIYLLAKPRSEEIYERYNEKIKNRWRKSVGTFHESLKEVYVAQMRDSFYRVKQLHLDVSDYQNFFQWLAPCFLATDYEFVDFVQQEELEVPKEVKELWDRMKKDHQFLCKITDERERVEEAFINEVQ